MYNQPLQNPGSGDVSLSWGVIDTRARGIADLLFKLSVFSYGAVASQIEAGRNAGPPI